VYIFHCLQDLSYPYLCDCECSRCRKEPFFFPSPPLPWLFSTTGSFGCFVPAHFLLLQLPNWIKQFEEISIVWKTATVYSIKYVPPLVIPSPQ